MRESYKEDLPNHFGLELYADGGNVMGVATTEVYAGKLLSSEITHTECRHCSCCGKAKRSIALLASQQTMGHSTSSAIPMITETRSPSKGGQIATESSGNGMMGVPHAFLNGEVTRQGSSRQPAVVIRELVILARVLRSKQQT